MGLLTTLGINSTFWAQLGLFLLAYLVLSQLVFKPYLRALEMRNKMTFGGEEEAQALISQAQNLTAEYEIKARKMNDKIRELFDKARQEAMLEYQQTVQTAKDSAEQTLATTREEIAKSVTTGRQKISQEVPSVSRQIASKLLGKEIAQ